VTGSLAAEWLKLSRRASTWILTLVMLSIVVGLSYFFLYVIARFAPSSPGFTEPVRHALKSSLYPHHFLVTVLGDFNGTGLGGAMILILGALSVGSEYGWGTVKTMFTQRPGRLTVMSAKLCVLFLVLVGYTVLLLGAGAASSFTAAALDRGPMDWPAAGDIGKAFAAGVLMLSVWAGLGVAMAAVLRSNALPIGLGLVYALIVEGIIGAFGQIDVVRTIQKVLPGPNETSLYRTFGTISAPGSRTPTPVASGEQAVLVLLAYVVVFIAVTMVVIRRRDVI
jgi:ABC-2 type transport system permease protein